MRTIISSALFLSVSTLGGVALAQPAGQVGAEAGAEAGAEGAEAGAEGAEGAEAGAPVAETLPPILGGPGESCEARADCAEGLACKDQVCTDPHEGESCAATADCGGKLRCIQNVCGGPQEDEADEGDDAGGGGGGLRNDLPVPYVKRPLTLPAMTLAPQLGFVGTHLSVGGFGGDVFGIDMGAAFGILDDLEVDARLLSLQFGDPDFDYGAFRVAATYRFVGSEVVEVGAKLRFYVDNGANIILNPGMPVRIHGGDIVRVDTGLDFGLVIANSRQFGNDVTFGIHDLDRAPYPAVGPWMTALSPQPGVPLNVAFQIVDFFWAGLDTGFGLLSFEDAGDTIFVPLGLEVGGTVPGDESPLVDIGAGFRFPVFVQSGGGDAIVTEVWQFGINAKGYIGL